METQEPPYDISTERSKDIEAKPKPVPEANTSSGLSISECKRHLGETDLTDKEIEELRDALSVVIDNIFDRYIDELNTYDTTED